MANKRADGPAAALVAISDLHVEVPENRRVVAELRPSTVRDWLILCGDVGEVMSDIEWCIRTLAGRFAQVVWVPGNHELWTTPDDPAQLRGDERYRHLVRFCRGLGVVTPEDPFPVWTGPGGPVVIAPLFTLYDYSFVPSARANGDGVVCSDELVLFSDPHATVGDWCRERIRISEARLVAASTDGLPFVLVGHFPLLRLLTRPLRYPGFARWCGTVMTADWHRRFNAVAVVYGHLHIPRTTVHDGVRFEEVSLGYPRQWRWRGEPERALRPIVRA